MDFNYEDERKKINDDLEISNQALNDLITRQQAEEQRIIDNQNGFGPQFNKFMRIFRTAKNGGDTSSIYNEYKQDLNTKLQNNQNKYKTMRDELLQKSKDALSRRDALDKFKYSMEQDQIKNDLANREFGLKTKTQADQNAIQKAQLDILRGQNAAKQNEAIQAQDQARKEKERQRRKLVRDLKFIDDGDYSDTNKVTGFLTDSTNAKKTASRINKWNKDFVRYDNPGVSEKDIPTLVKEYQKQGLLLDPTDSEDTTIEKAKTMGIGYGEPMKINGKVIINETYSTDTETGRPIIIYKVKDRNGSESFEYEYDD